MLTDKNALVTNRDTCPVCQSKNRTVLLNAKHNSPGFIDFIKFEKYYSESFYNCYNNGAIKDFDYNLVECNDCHFYYLTEVLNDYGMGLLYNDWLDQEMLKVHYKNLPHSSYAENILGLIKKHFSKKGQVNLMDFGAGYGNFCSMSVEKGFTTYAFDLSSDKNDFMNNMGVTILNDLSKYKNHFSFIWVNQVFEHVSSPLSIVKQLKESLADDGIIYIAVPDNTQLKSVIKQQGFSHDLFRLISPHQHINGFTNSTLKLLGTNSGLTPMSSFDFIKLFNFKLSIPELVLLAKRTMKGSNSSTGVFFKK